MQPQANPVVGFEEHFLSLTVENNLRNPWFVGESGKMEQSTTKKNASFNWLRGGEGGGCGLIAML